MLICENVVDYTLVVKATNQCLAVSHERASPSHDSFIFDARPATIPPADLVVYSLEQPWTSDQ